jgi:hypothetical protein
MIFRRAADAAEAEDAAAVECAGAVAECAEAVAVCAVAAEECAQAATAAALDIRRAAHLPWRARRAPR